MKRGVRVSAPHESDIMQSPPLYAYVDSTPFGRKILARRQEVAGRIGGMVAQRDQAQQLDYLPAGRAGGPRLFRKHLVWRRQRHGPDRLREQHSQGADRQMQIQIMQMGTALNQKPQNPPVPRRRRKSVAVPIMESQNG